MIGRGLLALGLAAAALPASAAPPPRCSMDFVRSVGVNTHLEAMDTQYRNFDQIVEFINYLGVSQIRDAAPRSPAGLATYQALVAAIPRVRFTLIVMGDPVRAMGSIRALAPHVDMVEGPNEVDRTPVHFRGLAGVDAVMADQRWIYDAVHADPALNGPAKHTPVLNFTLARPDYGPYGDLSTSADLMNVHAYALKGVPPFWMVAPSLHKVASFLNRPLVITETNFPTLIQPDGNGVTESVQAKWEPNTLLDSFRNGVLATYIYQLEDGVDDPGGHEFESHFGLFHFDGTPKPVAKALRNMLALLKDDHPCPTHIDHPPAYQVDLPHGAFDLLLARPDGTFVLILWAEPPIWNAAQNVEMPAPKSTRTVMFGADRHDVRVYDPLLGPQPIAEQRGVDQVAVTLTDHPILITIR